MLSNIKTWLWMLHFGCNFKDRDGTLKIINLMLLLTQTPLDFIYQYLNKSSIWWIQINTSATCLNYQLNKHFIMLLYQLLYIPLKILTLPWTFIITAIYKYSKFLSILSSIHFLPSRITQSNSRKEINTNRKSKIQEKEMRKKKLKAQRKMVSLT